MVNIGKYEGNNGQTIVKKEKKYPKREWVKIGVNERLYNVVLESAYFDRYARFGEAIYIFCHDGDTGELIGFALGVARGQDGRRGTVWSRMAVETLLDTSGEDGIYDPKIRDIFKDRKIWIGKTAVEGKSYNAFECDFIEGVPKFDSSYDGTEEAQDEAQDDQQVDMSDPINAYIREELSVGTDPLNLVQLVEGKFEITREAALKRIMDVKGSM